MRPFLTRVGWLPALMIFLSIGTPWSSSAETAVPPLETQRVYEALEKDPERLLTLLEKARGQQKKTAFFKNLKSSLSDRIEVAPRTPVMVSGAEAAPIKITVFSDFFCWFSKGMDGILREFAAQNPGKVRLEYRFFPSDENASMASAVYVEALNRVDPEKAVALYHRLFEIQEILAGNTENVLAAEFSQMGVDIERVLELARSESVQKAVLDDIAEAHRLGVKGTPLICINGVRLLGQFPLAWLDEAVQQILVAAQPPKGGE